MKRVNSSKLAIILGTRPEIIKMYPVIKQCRDVGYPFVIIHTNQHYDEKMDRIFFEDLGLPKPDYNLNIGSGSQGQQTGRMMEEIEKVLVIEKPAVVIVQGDTNTVLAGALVASKMGIKVAHVEAGLRSGDWSMPEEINRILTDRVSDWLFCPTSLQSDVLIKEGVEKHKIFITGNTIVDTVLEVSSQMDKNDAVWRKYGVVREKYFLMTCHRPANTDDDVVLKNILDGINKICMKKNAKCLFPVHPRLKNKMNLIKKYDKITILDPVNYPDMLALQKGCHMMFTDSGGIQEEACILQKKCLILRTNTERPETLRVGGATLLDEMTSRDIIVKYDLLLEKKVEWYNPFGDGKAGEKIVKIIDNVL